MSEDFLTERRRERMRRALENRTRRLTILLEDIYDPLNASAVLRTCDGLGIQDIHIAENRHAFHAHSKVAGRAAAWLTIHRYCSGYTNTKTDFRIKPEGVQSSTAEAFAALKNAGYTILATSPRGQSTPLKNLDMSKKYAIALGSEHWGLSDWAIENADATVALPMLGFTESYNISVTAAMVLFYLAERLRSENSDWKLSAIESQEIWREWSRFKK
ncbi:MAG: RNA methyltransferase [Spirochaetes bacterium]|nr:RNA methyltransferase [Spirochaetota bacterium]